MKKDKRDCYCVEELERYNGGTEMNSWRDDPCKSPADTYIERCFEQKCKQLKYGFDIITEWRIRKRQYISYLETTAFDFQHFSRHDESHSINILESIEMLLGKKKIDLLNASDLWLLLECAYMHDMGMTISYDELIEYWEEDEEFHKHIKNALIGEDNDLQYAAYYFAMIDDLLREKKSLFEGKKVSYLEEIFPASWPVELCKCVSLLITDYVRSKHTQRVLKSERKIDSTTDPVIPDRLYKVMVEACSMHGKDFGQIEKELKYCCKGLGNEKMHPRFAAAMLRIGDMLDLDNNRFNPRTIEHYGRLPIVSMLHYKKHRAVTHLAIKESGIEAEAISNDISTCTVTSTWFQALEEETRDLCCSWNTIVPVEIGGCLLQPSQCRVFYEDANGYRTDFSAKPAKEFEVNKKKLIEVLIGANIYSNSMDFIREYIQNALDATKMKLWLDLKEGVHRYTDEINQNIILEEITPFDISSNLYARYEIQIKIELDMKKRIVKLIFSDHGIGMEEDCIKVLSKVGTGWYGRNEYGTIIQEMPKWLAPTGGFGIGIQSAFMVADEISIRTRDRKSSKGRKITLYSPKKKGTVLVEGEINCKRGTDIEIPVKINEFLETNRKYEQMARRIDTQNKGSDVWNWCKEMFVQKNKEDFFSEKCIMESIVEFLGKYIETLIPGMLFPIRIIYSLGGIQHDKLYKNKRFPKGNLWGNGNETVLTSEVIMYNTKYLCIIQQDESIENITRVTIWDSANNICYYMSFGWNLPKREMAVCFKNVLVRGEVTPDFKWLGRISVLVDYMGFSARDIININRDKFSEKFNDKSGDEFLKNGYKVFFKMIEELPEKEKEKPLVEKLCSSIEQKDVLVLRTIHLGEELCWDKYFYKPDEKINCSKFVWENEIEEVKLIEKSASYSVKDFLKEIETFIHQGLQEEETEKELIIRVSKNQRVRNLIPEDAINYWYKTSTQEGSERYKARIMEKIEKEHSDYDEVRKSREMQAEYQNYKETVEFSNKEYFKILQRIEKNSDLIITGKYAKELIELPHVKVETFGFEKKDSVYAFISLDKKKKTLDKKQIYKESYEKINSEKIYVVQDVEADFYPALQIDGLPFSKEKDKLKRKIISPVSSEAY